MPMMYVKSFSIVGHVELDLVSANQKPSNEVTIGPDEPLARRTFCQRFSSHSSTSFLSSTF